jgi:hypothetical protein
VPFVDLTPRRASFVLGDRDPLRNDYSSISYFYVDHPEGDAPALPPLAERIPKLLPLPGAK